MGFLLVVAAACLIAAQPPKTLVYAAPSMEPCPSDSILSSDVCKCDLDSCRKPPCPSDLVIATNGTDIPGSCCPIYSCEGCKNETLIDGKCPCADGAVIDPAGICKCTDAEKHLVDGKCVCNPNSCELPLLCDKKSVLVTVSDTGCCKKTKCKACPEDSESTNLDSDDIEDHCVCLPCKNDCGVNKTVVIKKRGSGFPGNCCDFYECKPLELETDKDCIMGDIIYADGEEWSTSDRHQCKCQNGLSLCSTIQEEKSQSCYVDGKLYKHNETWTKEDGCTNCTCVNGEDKCISHYCDFKQSEIDQNVTHPCFKENKIYQHLDTWTQEDACTLCTCINGEEKCDASACEATNKETYPKNECQPLFSCNRTCPHGFKLNKKGCEICRCNGPRITVEILQKYNITMNDLINILEDYKKGRTSTTTATTIINTTPPAVMIEDRIVVVSTTTTESSVVTADKQDQDNNEPVIIAGILLAITLLAVIVVMVACCVLKKRKSQSMDLTHCHYKTVNENINNNHIEKTADPLIKK